MRKRPRVLSTYTTVIAGQTVVVQRYEAVRPDEDVEDVTFAHPSNPAPLVMDLTCLEEPAEEEYPRRRVPVNPLDWEE